MAELKRVPTEMEVRILLRDAARKMEDEAAIGECLSWTRRRFLGAPLVLLGALFVGMAVLPFLDRSVPVVVWSALACLMSVAFGQGAVIYRLTRVTAALARMSERSRAAKPLPRAPSTSASTS